MANVRCMHVLQGGSGLPEDRFINTFHFTDGEGGSTDAAHQSACRAKVLDFYSGVGVAPGAQNYPLQAYFSPLCSRFGQIISYDLEEPGRGHTGEPPRTPSYTNFEMVQPKDGGGGAPEEVAVVLTLHGLPPVTPRRRGRLYFGPLLLSVVNPATTTDPARPQNNFISDVLKAAARLATSVTDEMFWSIRSSLPTENFVNVVSGYIDNAFDTQRRRGPDASSRQTFTGLVG